MAAPMNVVILAAGSGTRMKSSTHKVLHQLAGVPMVKHVLNAARELSPERIAVVVGHQAEEVQSALAGEDIEFVMQEEQLGTAHAFLQTADLLESTDRNTLVLSGDGALLNYLNDRYRLTLCGMCESPEQARAVREMLG